uniref:Uncharacterized protein n=1 Tax=Aegilops tauschii subsp. strangulata TaxID=200361 RepID=A0A453IP21_AEGTS
WNRAVQLLARLSPSTPVPAPAPYIIQQRPNGHVRRPSHFHGPPRALPDLPCLPSQPLVGHRRADPLRHLLPAHHHPAQLLASPHVPPLRAGADARAGDAHHQRLVVELLRENRPCHHRDTSRRRLGHRAPPAVCHERGNSRVPQHRHLRCPPPDHQPAATRRGVHVGERRIVLVPDDPHEVRAGVREAHAELRHLLAREPGEAAEADVYHRPRGLRVEPAQDACGLRGGTSVPTAAALPDVVAVTVDEADRPDGEHRLPGVLLVMLHVPRLEVGERVDDPAGRGALDVEHAVQELPRVRAGERRLGEPRPGEPHRVREARHEERLRGRRDPLLRGVEEQGPLHREREAAGAGERVPRNAELGGGGGGPREDAVEHDGVGGVAAQEVGEERREEVDGDGERPRILTSGEVVGALVPAREPRGLGGQGQRVDADAEARSGRAGHGAAEPGGVGVREDEGGVGAARREEAGQVGHRQRVARRRERDEVHARRRVARR